MLDFRVHVLIASYITRTYDASLYFSCIGDMFLMPCTECKNHEESWISPRVNQNISGMHNWLAVPDSKLSTNQYKETLTRIKMLIWLVVGGLLTNDKVVIGSRVARGSQQLQCPQVSASFGDLSLSSFSVFINQSDGVRDDGNSSDGGQCKFVVT